MYSYSERNLLGTEEKQELETTNHAMSGGYLL